MIGQTLGHYRIVEKIGEGGMGVVYRAHDQRLDRDVALKVLPAGTLADEAIRQRFRKEALALSRLNHPNIETVYDFDSQEGTDFLVMELIPGLTLDKKLAAGALPEREIARLGVQLAEGLVAAHKQEVTHRDIKPGNLRVTPEGRLKILDFGLATLRRPAETGATTESASDSQAAGTLPYMAPEQLRGEKADARSDIYAAGAVLYEMATGQRPFPETHGPLLTDAILHQAPLAPSALNRRVSPALESIILKAMDKEPERRYQSARELVVDLERLTAPTPVVAAVPRPQPPARRWVLAVGALLVLAGLGARIGIWYQQPPTPPPAPAAAKPSVAVLPFQNLSADAGNEYFSDGMTDEIISKLSRIQGLQVASRTSMARFKGTKKDIKEIGKELGVRYLLEGSVRKAENRVRITAQLIDTSSGFHLWAEDFERDLKDVFAVQEETALKIAQALNLRLTPQEQQAVRRRYTDNPKAYDAYLRGRALVEYFDIPEKLEAARGYFEQALNSDPNYPLALAGLSHVEGQYYRNLDASQDRLRRSEQLARRALALDPQLVDAHLAIGRAYANRYDYAGAAEKFREATRLEPDNPYAWDYLSWALAYQQPPDAAGAEKAARESVRLQPTLFAAYYHLGRALFLQRRYQEAAAAFEHARTLYPAFTAPHLGLAQVYLAQKNYDRALAELTQLTRRTPVILIQFSSVYAARGEKEKALAELEKALAGGYRDFAALDSNPYLASLHSDPRFQQLLSRYRK